MRLLIILSSVLAADAVLACGGLFCSAANPIVVDQTSERIVFEVLETGDVRTTVDIVYSGNPEDFSWIVPVPEVPSELDVTSRNFINQLDQNSFVQIFPPILDSSNCPRSTGQALGGGFACGEAIIDQQGAAPPPANRVVDVTELDDVGPFGDIVVVDAAEVSAIFDFLTDNDYTLTDAMRPVIRDYHDEGMKFLALRLQPGQATDAIQPLVFTCPQEDGGVSIPLRLTSVAAEPEMSVTVFIIANERFAPMNYAGLTVNPDDVHSLFGQNNYFPLVSKMVDDAGGRAFVTEASLSNLTVPIFDDDFNLVENRQINHLTRLYTRISPWEMTQDPVFMPTGDTQGQNPVIDLSTRVLDVCNFNITAPLCGTTYCGAGAECVATDSGPACLCPQGQTARSVSTPNGQQPFCVEDDVTDPLAELAINACDGNPCGANGTCTTAFGRATCACDEGFAAVTAGFNSVTCAAINGIDPGDLDWTPTFEAAGPPNCGQMPVSQYALTFGTLALVLVAVRRLKRRR